MKRREFVKRVSAGAAAVWAETAFRAQADAQEPTHPNILWISCEDMSPNLGAYGDSFASTPNLDALASEGVCYTNAFTHAPVCAPSRSGIITGMYPTSIGSHHMRSTANLPDDVRCFTQYLRAAGYYCTNCSKEDYNFKTPPEAWDDSSGKAHWRHRRSGQPFFSVFNLTVTHESQIRLPDPKFAERVSRLPEQQRHDPAKVRVPPYHPDTPEVRKDWQHYYDLISVMDAEAGQLLRALEEDGLSEDTIVFFFSDHGAGMPRCKRWLYDSGLHVPLIARFPRKYRRLAPAPPGGTVDRLVSFVDLAPTMLSLTATPIPAHFQGQAFLGRWAAPPREYVFAGRDRMDERYDASRAVRDRRFKYIRNLMPHLSRGQYHEYMFQMPTMQAWARLAREGRLDGPPALFMRETKPVEELYDLETDPFEIRNLIDSETHNDVLERMRGALAEWMTTTRDLGLLPEAEMHKRAGDRPLFQLAQDREANPVNQLLAIVDLQRSPTKSKESLLQYLDAPDAAMRFWALIGLHQHCNDARETWLDAAEQRLKDTSPSVRVAAAELLGRCRRAERALPLLMRELQNDNEWVRLHAANVLDRLGEQARPALDLFRALMNDRNQYVVRVAKHAVESLAGSVAQQKAE